MRPDLYRVHCTLLHPVATGLCVCVYVCTYVPKYVCTYYVFMYVCMYAYMYACMYAYMHVCIYVRMYVCMYRGADKSLARPGRKKLRQKILSFIYPIYNHNWRNISTIYTVYITRLASNEIF